MDERERKVVELRFGLKGEHPRTLAEVSSRFNVSRERIRQIEAKALEQIKASEEIQAMREIGLGFRRRCAARSGTSTER